MTTPAVTVIKTESKGTGERPLNAETPSGTGTQAFEAAASKRLCGAKEELVKAAEAYAATTRRDEFARLDLRVDQMSREIKKLKEENQALVKEVNEVKKESKVEERRHAILESIMNEEAKESQKEIETLEEVLWEVKEELQVEKNRAERIAEAMKKVKAAVAAVDLVEDQ